MKKIPVIWIALYAGVEFLLFLAGFAADVFVKYDFIGERDNRPIINVSPLVEGDIDAKLEWIVQNKHQLPDLSRRSRGFVVKHNDSHVVARRHVEFYEKILKQ